eukprot:20527-Heterococcus_DN1.PRE.2
MMTVSRVPGRNLNELKPRSGVIVPASRTSTSIANSEAIADTIAQQLSKCIPVHYTDRGAQRCAHHVSLVYQCISSERAQLTVAAAVPTRHAECKQQSLKRVASSHIASAAPVDIWRTVHSRQTAALSVYRALDSSCSSSVAELHSDEDEKQLFDELEVQQPTLAANTAQCKQWSSVTLSSSAQQRAHLSAYT